YINTPQTILYDKSRILYGFDKARIEIRKKDFCVLVEGQMDVIMSHQAGFTNTIAVSGTALTIEHLRMIKRLTNNLVIAFDGDEAGFRASKRGIDLALSEGIEVKVAVVPFGKDPADAIKENPEVWARALNKAEHIIKFYLDFLSERKEIEETVLPYIVLLPSEIEKAHWIRETAKKLFIKEDSIWEELKKIKHVLRTEFRPQNAPKVEMSDKPRLKLLEERLSGFILWQKDSNDKELQEEMERIIKKYDWERLGREPDKTEKLVFGAELFYNEAENLKEELSKLALELEKEGIKNHLGEISENIRRLENSGEKDKLKDSLDKFYKLTKELSSLNVYDKKNKKTN
ncbi:MAG TPA: toprim domain-containing protein, partial [Candidatus Campbellbacteria bacterium]|nr:toprim domain-containing protein [Candidatus Campbellbacteria bacterium]